MTGRRRVSFPLWLATRRVAAARRPVAVAAFGVAVAASALAVAFAAAAVVENRAVADAIEGLPPGNRDVEVSWVGVSRGPTERQGALDGRARAALASLGLVPEARTLVYREARIDGEDVRLAAVDDLARWFVVRRGRLPRPCRPARCETLAVGNAARPSLAQLPVVGVGEPRPGTPARRLLGASSLVAEGVGGAARLRRLESVLHSFTWSAPLESADLTAWKLDGFELAVTRTRTRLLTESFRFGLSAPTDALDQVALDARVTYRRLLLVGVECAVLFLVFALVAASTLRPRARAASRRLRRFGARRWQVHLVTAAEASAIVVPAAALGWVAGGVGAAALAAATDTPASPLLRRTIVSSAGLGLVSSLALVAVVILFAAVRSQPVLVRGRGLSVVDVAAGAAILAAAMAFAVGQTDAEALARDRGTGFVVLLVPALLIVAGAILAARLTAPIFRLAERIAPRQRPALRLALLSAARNPGTQLVTVGFLVVSVGLAIFAGMYRSTLLEGERAEAAFKIPLDYTVRNAAQRTADDRPAGAIFSGRDAVPVIRRSGQARSLNLTETIDVLGVRAEALRELRWRSDFSRTDRAELARLIAPAQPLRPVGPRLPHDATVLELPARVSGDPIAVAASIRAENGSYLTLDVGKAPSARTVLRARVPRTARGGTLVGLTLEIPPAESFSAAHAAAEGSGPDVFSVGKLTLGRPRVRTPTGSRPVAVDYARWVVGTRTAPRASGPREMLRITYLLTREQVFRLRPRQPTDGGPVPVIACDSLAERVGSDGVVPLSIGPADVNARIVARAALFPSARCPFVVADERTLETAVTAAAPGAAVPDEAWIAGTAGLARSLERAARPTPVAVTSRRALEAELRDDPLARGTVAVLAAGSLVALVLAVLAVLLVVAAELRDQADDYFDLESQGMAPAALRRQLVLRIGSLVAAGVLWGLLTGGVLALVVTKLVAVGAGRGAPLPPLVLTVSWREIALGLLAFGIAVGLVLIGATRRAFAGPVPARSGELR